MSSITALELINRVMLFRRQPTTTVIATPEDEATLNAVNMAIEDALSTKRWEFDLRHDGQLTLKGRLDGVTISTVADSVSATLGPGTTTAVGSDVVGDFVVRILPDGITDYANTPLRTESISSIVGGIGVFTLETTFPTTNTDADCELHYSEYILPDTVRGITRVTYQEDPLELRQIDPSVRYEELYPNPHEDTGPPEVVSIGGYDRPAHLVANAGTTDPGLRLAVWPVPDDDYIINYSYYYRHPELVAATDKLTGVPPAVVNDIVWQAASTVMMTWDQNFAASHFTDLSRQQAAAKHLAYGGSNARRRTIGSFETGRNSTRVQLGFPNKLIGQ